MDNTTTYPYQASSPSGGNEHRKTVRLFLLKNVNTRKALLFGREIIFILAMYFLYQLCFLLTGRLYPEEQHKEVALKNAHNLVKFETAVGLHFLELSLQDLFVRILDIAILMKFINAFYLGLHLPVSLFFFFHLAYSRISNQKTIVSKTTYSTTSDNTNSSNNSALASPNSAPLEVVVDRSTVTTIYSDTPDESLSLAASEDNGDSKETTFVAASTDSRGTSKYRSCTTRIWREVKNLGSLRISVRDYKRFRWSLAVIHLMFGITIIAFPVAPPRMLPDKGYVDTIIIYSRTDITKTEERLGVNPYAAMPSLHFTYALFVGIGYYFFAMKRWLRVLGVAYTITVGFIIVITGNHYFSDAIAALIYTSIAVWLSRVIVNFTSKRRFKSIEWIENKCEALYRRIFGHSGDQEIAPLITEEQDEQDVQVVTQG